LLTTILSSRQFPLNQTKTPSLMEKFAMSGFRPICLVVALGVSSGAAAQEHGFHPPQDMPLHEKFYSTWYMPDNPTKSCCNKADCYPTEVKHVGTTLLARRREDGAWIVVPPQKIEHNRDNPDGRNHVCMPPPTSSQAGTVFCFSLGSGT
jgi:hypothetical protein